MYLTTAEFMEITAEKTAHKETQYLKDEGHKQFYTNFRDASALVLTTAIMGITVFLYVMSRN